MAEPLTVYSQIPIFNPCIPKEGPRVIPLQFDFTNIDEFTVDLNNQVQQGLISCVQTLFVDNTSDQVITFTAAPGTGHILRIPAYTQGYFPFFCANPPTFKAETAAGGGIIKAWALNTPLPCQLWSVGAP